MPDSIIKQVEELAERERVGKGLHFRSRGREMFDRENENYNHDQNMPDKVMSPYPVIAAELLGTE